MTRTVRIGGACGFYGDSSVAPAQLIGAGVDYLILDYLAEATMSVLGNMKKHRADLGYAADFTEWVWKDNLRAIKETGTRIVTNAGGVNPQGCAARLAKIAADAGLSFRIAIVEGDELLDRLDELSDQSEMFTGTPFPPREQIVTANAYLGATPIARALAMGADVVITGRAVDSALTLGITMHEFGWTADDYDLLSAGSLAGHVIECGAQGSGALFTDWEDVPDWAHIGYPIVECAADGSFVVTKPEGTGGLVSPAVVAEQILYEVGDPQAYMLPDVVCDFTQVTVEQVGDHRVRVAGAIGYPPSGKYKVSITHQDGERCIGFMPVVGRDAARKAQRQGEAVLTRVEEMLRDRNLGPFRAKRIEIIGAESSYGANARAQDTREVICKVAVEHDDNRAFRYFLREFDSPTTSMSAGTTGWFGGRAQVTPVMRVFSCLIEREDVPVTVTLGSTETVATPAPATRFSASMIVRPEPGESLVAQDETRTVPLIDLAWARSGDKGDAFNIGVIARKPAYMPYIRAALTEGAMRQFFAHEFEGARNPAVHRYEVPGLDALNLHFLDSLGGGQFASLRLDPLAKGKAQQLLDFAVTIPANL
ncbi:MAG: acyclic terpene utilization AtuA family protein [Sphingobium sp.]